MDENYLNTVSELEAAGVVSGATVVVLFALQSSNCSLRLDFWRAKTMVEITNAKRHIPKKVMSLLSAIQPGKKRISIFTEWSETKLKKKSLTQNSGQCIIHFIDDFFSSLVRFELNELICDRVTPNYSKNITALLAWISISIGRWYNSISI